MVEPQLYPPHGAVALLAFPAVATSMLVIVFVTRKAGFTLCVVLEVAAVTGDTASPAVFPLERELGLRVVIEVCLLPINRGMARVTLIAVATEVNVVEAVAGNAGRGCVLVALVGMA
ncbi:MAG: hypothetical protein V3S24_13795 [Candidatus Tectomicrobia bacterium]